MIERGEELELLKNPTKNGQNLGYGSITKNLLDAFSSFTHSTQHLEVSVCQSLPHPSDRKHWVLIWRSVELQLRLAPHWFARSETTHRIELSKAFHNLVHEVVLMKKPYTIRAREQ